MQKALTVRYGKIYSFTYSLKISKYLNEYLISTTATNLNRRIVYSEEIIVSFATYILLVGARTVNDNFIQNDIINWNNFYKLYNHYFHLNLPYCYECQIKVKTFISQDSRVCKSQK